MFFVVFDLEGVFPFSWAVAGSELGWTRLLGSVDLHALATVVIANWVLSKPLLHLIQGPDCRNGGSIARPGREVDRWCRFRRF